ncbi:MAG: hypothetical protein A2252_02035 [Elusimicrobia bacterium RIFOXYA2_FULL_39_19]|nr:MAG: hypothetical protein A2252_02035 [Elusimicrobia bacterium RIFOXYA2_FULL_39_19]
MAKNKRLAQEKQQQQKKILAKTEFLKPLLPGFIIFAGILTWGFYISQNYFKQYPVNLNWVGFILSLDEFPNAVAGNVISVFTDHLATMLTALLIFIAAFGAGEKLRNLIGIGSGNKQEDWLYSMGLGFTAIIYSTFIIGMLGGLYQQFFWLIFVGLGILGALEIKKCYLLPAPAVEKVKSSWLFSGIVLALALLIGLVTALAPETFYDSTQYHLGVPLIWVQNHRICEIPTIQQSFYQMNMHLLYVITILLKYEGASKIVNYMFGLLGMVLLYTFAKKYFSKKQGLLTAAMFYCTPVVLFVTSRSCIELPMVFFEILSIFCVFNWLVTKNDKWFYLTAVFSGTALGSKHTAVFGFISICVASLIYFLLYRRDEMASFLKKAVIFLMIGFVFVSPWLIKSYVFVGNPIYPFKLSITGGVIQESKKKDISYIDQSPIPLTPLNIVTIPWRSTMGQFQESFTGMVFLMFIPLLFLFRKTSRYAKFIFFYIVPYYLLWIVIGRCYLRFLITPLALLSVVYAFYITEADIPKVFKTLLVGVLVVLFGTNCFLMMSSQKMSQNPLGVILGLQSKMDYLATSRQSYPCPYYQTVDWINRNLPENSKVAFFGETRPYYMRRKVLTHSAGDFNQIILWCKEVKTAEELKSKLAKEGVTHFMVNVPEARRLTAYDILQFEGNDLKVFIAFWNKYLKEINAGVADVMLNDGRRASAVPEFWSQYASNPFSAVHLYEIMPEEEAGKPYGAPLNFFLYKEMYNTARLEYLGSVIEKLQK